MGRTTLVTSVLASASVYHMSSLLLFKDTVEKLLSRNNVLFYGRVKTNVEGANVKLHGMMFPFLMKKVVWVYLI
jgi:hypothetical protein